MSFKRSLRELDKQFTPRFQRGDVLEHSDGSLYIVSVVEASTEYYGLCALVETAGLIVMPSSRFKVEEWDVKRVGHTKLEGSNANP